MLTDEQLNTLRKQLEDMRQELVANRDRETAEAAQMSADSYEEHPLSQHMADEATDMHEQELEMGFRERDSWQLQQVEHALHLMDTGKYGVDEETGEPIPFERLQLIPYTTRSVQTQAHEDALNVSTPDRDILEQDDQVQSQLSS